MGLVVLFFPYLLHTWDPSPAAAETPRAQESREEGFWVHHCPPCDYAQVKPQYVRGKLLTPSYSHGPLPPCFPAQQSPSHQRLRVLALGRWLLAGPSRELRRPRNVPLVGEGVPGEVEHSLYFWQHWIATEGGEGRCGEVLGQPLSYSFMPPFSPMAYF